MARRPGLCPLDRPAYDPRLTPVTPEADIGGPSLGDFEDDRGGAFARLRGAGRLLDTVRADSDRVAVLSVGLLACTVACGERALPPNELDLNAVRGWDYGVSFVVEVERVGSSFSWTKTFESAEPGVYRFASDLPGVTEVGDRARTLFVFADDHTHRHLVPHDGWLLLSDPSMLDALVVERVWLDGDLTCAEVSGPPGVVAVTEVCVRRVPPLVGMIERVTTSPVDGGPACPCATRVGARARRPGRCALRHRASPGLDRHHHGGGPALDRGRGQSMRIPERAYVAGGADA